MSDSPSNPGGGRPVRPAIPPFRGPAGGGGAGGPARPAVPPARAPLPPRPAVSPLPPITARPVSRPATPARSPYVTPSRAQPPAPAVRPAALSPVIAQPEVLPDPIGEIVASIPAPAGDPLAGLDVIDAGPAPAATDAAARVQPNTEPTTAGQGGTDWLSPEGALKGEFGDLVENIPQRPNAQAPVFPTPPAPWPTIAANPASAQPAEAPGGGAGMLADLDAGFEEVLGTASAHPEAGAPSDQPLAGTGAAGSDMAAADAPQAEVWADSYGAEADAIHGDLEPAAQGGSDPLAGLPTLPPSGDPASYLASEWPEPAAADASSVPTPVVPGPAILPGWDAAGATRTPAAPVPPDPLLDAARHQDDDAFRWGKTPQETPADSIGAIERSTSAVDEWAFGPAEDDPGRPVVTASSLAAAEALERVAVQLRQGTLRADGFAPALGEAAALSAALAALLGIDARWDVQR